MSFASKQARECYAPCEVAKVLGIGLRQARAWINSGKIYSFRVGRRILVPRQAIDRLLAGRAAAEEEA